MLDGEADRDKQLAQMIEKSFSEAADHTRWNSTRSAGPAADIDHPAAVIMQLAEVVKKILQDLIERIDMGVQAERDELGSMESLNPEMEIDPRDILNILASANDINAMRRALQDVIRLLMVRSQLGAQVIRRELAELTEFLTKVSVETTKWSAEQTN